jgi:hypothetical protein
LGAAGVAGLLGWDGAAGFVGAAGLSDDEAPFVSPLCGELSFSCFAFGSGFAFGFCGRLPPALPTSLSLPWLPSVPDTPDAESSDFPAPASLVLIAPGWAPALVDTPAKTKTAPLTAIHRANRFTIAAAVAPPRR